jgi:uncharacterized protein
VTEGTRTLVRYRLSRLSRAKEAIEEAVLLLESDHTNTFVNRLYYACFYAVSALLLTKGLSATRHSGIRVLFHQNIVKPGLLSISQGSIYDKLFDNRQKGDYVDLIRFEVQDVQSWLDEARAFVGDVEALILEEIDGPHP